MKVKITYPPPKRKRVQRSDLIGWMKWPFLLAAYLCPVVNISTGGRAWSVVVLYSLHIVWSLVLSPAVIQYNRISQFIKLTVKSCILLILVDALLSPGWAAEVVPIVCFSGLILVGLLFFTDRERQRHNVLPLLLLSAAAFLAAVAGLIFLRDCSRWPLAVMGALALALLVSLAIAFEGGPAQELRKLFHTR